MEDDILGGVGVIDAKGTRTDANDFGEGLYYTGNRPREEECSIRLIPYYAWANRGEGEMRVWLNETRRKC